MSNSTPLPCSWWWQWRVIHRCIIAYLLWHLLTHTWRECLWSLRVHKARLHLWAHWRAEVRDYLRAWTETLLRNSGAQAPALAEIRARTADLVPLENRCKPAKRQRKPEASA